MLIRRLDARRGSVQEWVAVRSKAAVGTYPGHGAAGEVDVPGRTHLAGFLAEAT